MSFVINMEKSGTKSKEKMGAKGKKGKKGKKETEVNEVTLRIDDHDDDDDDENKDDDNLLSVGEVCDINEINKLYSKTCGNNKEQLQTELKNREYLQEHTEEDQFLYPILDDPNFIIKIAQKKEFSDTKYDGSIYNIEEYAKVLSTAEYELLPQQAFVKNFLSFQTPYNSLLLFHGLGSGKTCSAIGVCEEMRDYLRQMGISKRIIIVASPNVQDNFKLQLFDERKLKEVDGIWTMKGCLGNKLLKEINPTGMKGLKREKVIQQVKNLISASYSFQGYLQFSNEIVRKSGKSSDSMETKIRNLENEYSDNLIVIDEVHNIRISDDNENKSVAKNLMFLVSAVSNIRLLLLSATPMFNSYKEIIWILNLMNMNDRRGIVSVSDIFDKNGGWKKDKDGHEIGKEMLIRKATGYVSYVRGENPYTFPFRVYPDRFAKDNTFTTKEEYPNYQINGRRIPEDRKMEKLSLFLTAIGSYQEMGYNYIVDRLRTRGEATKMTRHGMQRKVSAFASLKSFGYTDLQIPIEALNIVYPYPGLEDLVKTIGPLEYIEEEEQEIDDISPATGAPEKGAVEEIDEIVSEGPQFVASVKSEIKGQNSELESEPVVTEGVEADQTMFDYVNEEEINRLENSVLNAEPVTDSVFDMEEPISSLTYDNSRSNAPIIDSSVKPVKKSITKEKPTLSTKPDTSFTGTLVRKSKEGKEGKEGEHIIEGITVSQFPSIKNQVKETSSFKGGVKSDPDLDSNSETRLFIDPKDLTGSQGLKRVMDYVDSKTPATKGQFEYKRGMPHVFESEEIGKYSAKIKTVTNYIYNKETGKVADGIILIYSSYIDAGVIPMALALEEMGFTRYGEKAKPLFKSAPTPVVDVRTMKPPSNKKDFKPARYIMITGDPRISPHNDADVKAITSNDNLFEKDSDGNIVDISGQKIKVVLISQAGSEGLDFKAIRQVHILEPWYNVNRIEQIIGRAVRNFSHKELPFTKRNVQIFLYGTLLSNAEEEAADLYIYRVSELKAVKIGKVTRLLKQTAVDCIINHDQTNFTSENFEEIKENRNIKQILSDHQKLQHFAIGDMENSPTCDFMTCEFQCLPDIDLEDTKLNTDTYNETFMLVNSDKIIQKIKMLMKMRYFYKKNDLIQLINIPKKYPIEQIYAALTQIINDNTEYITDRYGRTGYLINIGEYYLFQPSELNYKNISIFDRSVPINYKHDLIKFSIKPSTGKPVIDKRAIEEVNAPSVGHNTVVGLEPVLETEKERKIVRAKEREGKLILDTMFANYNLALETSKVARGNDNWYQHCGLVLRKMSKDNEIIPASSDTERLDILEQFLIEHIVDSLMMEERIHLLNYTYNDEPKTNELLKRFFAKVKKYLLSKVIVSKGLTGMVIFNGPSRVENLHIFILNSDTNTWVPAQPEDKRDLEDAILKKYRLKTNLNHYVGFIGFETNKKFMVYKVKDTENKRSTGFRCDQSGKDKIIKLLNDIEVDERFASKETKEGAFELCVRQEFTLRSFENQKLENKTWFLDTETAIINEFEKKEKVKTG